MCGGGGKGGDGGAAERKAAEENRQRAAIGKLNRTFGVAADAPTTAAPGREQFMSDVMRRVNAGPTKGGGARDMGGFDQAGYQAAMGQWQEQQAAADGEVGRTRQAREGLYGTIAADSKALQLDGLNREREVAQRDVNFDLARRGLFGGSRQVDTAREIEDGFSRGVLEADNNAQSVANEARMGDEKTRVSLINSIRSGMDEGDATSAAFSALQNNASQAANNARNQSVSGFFDGIRGAANQYQQAGAYEDQFKKFRAGGGAAVGGSNGVVRDA